VSPVSTRPSSRQAPGTRQAPRHQAGFTILELLVVLVLIGLVSFVLLAGFDRVLDIRLRLASFLDGVEAPMLVADWFRATIGGLVADAPNGPDRFVGQSRRLTGLSLAPLSGTAGVPTRITWEVNFDELTGRSALSYSNAGDQPMVIASWPGDSGSLSYCGPDLVCHDAWPPDRRASQLPMLVRLYAVKGADAWPILAAPQSDRAPLGGVTDEP
jgi:prepilin-type N-terminal cleavage/methylation domain-containing protein